ncbi:MAG: GIY-YIG nuclease family protein [Candidatus Komeilibacteria bacterium]
MLYVDYLKSLVNEYIYIGSCHDVKKRLVRHNGGYVKSTKAYRPGELLECEEYETRSEAFRWEKFLKTGQQREILKKKYKDK